MQTITLYRYIRADGGITTSPVKPDGEYTEMYRLIADEGKALTDGTTVTNCADVASPDGWTEIDAPDDEIGEMTEVAQKAAAYDILTGVTE